MYSLIANFGKMKKNIYVEMATENATSQTQLLLGVLRYFFLP
jgi:hypothetical protein